MNHTIEKEYSYVMGWGQLLFLIAIGAVLGTFMTNEALNNKAGLTINRIIELGPNGATIFYWSITGVMYMLILLGVIGIIEKIKGRSRIAITPEGVILPNAPWKKGEAYFTYNSIKDLSLRTMKKAKFLTIKTTGKSYLIASNRLNKPHEFDEITKILDERKKGAWTH